MNVYEKIIAMFSPYMGDRFLDFDGLEVIHGPSDRAFIGFDTNFPLKWLVEDYGFTEDEARWFISEVSRLYAKTKWPRAESGEPHEPPLRICPFCKKQAVFIGVHDDEGNYRGRIGCEYEQDAWSGLSYALHHEGWGDCILCTDGEEQLMGGVLFDTAEDAAEEWNEGLIE